MSETRKGVTAFELEPMEENGDEFFVLTFHHGLGRMTRLDLDAEELRELKRLIRDELKGNDSVTLIELPDAETLGNKMVKLATGPGRRPNARFIGSVNGWAQLALRALGGKP